MKYFTDHHILCWYWSSWGYYSLLRHIYRNHKLFENWWYLFWKMRCENVIFRYWISCAYHSCVHISCAYQCWISRLKPPNINTITTQWMHDALPFYAIRMFKSYENYDLTSQMQPLPIEVNCSFYLRTYIRIGKFCRTWFLKNLLLNL